MEHTTRRLCKIVINIDPLTPPLIVSRFSFKGLSLIAFFFLEVQNKQQGQGSFEYPDQPQLFRLNLSTDQACLCL